MARPKKPTDELKDQRVPIMMSEDELKAIDDWRFENRLGSRGEAIRRLCNIALELDNPVIFNAALAVSFSKGTDEAFRMMVENLEDADATDEQKTSQISATRKWFRRSADHILQYAGILLTITQASRLPGRATDVIEAAKEKSMKLQSLTDPSDKTLDEIMRSVFPDLDDEIRKKREAKKN
ncbi:hypothetical protein HFN98_18020 [Rhizobium laguerreae]|uniref:hypothetical protein n=1 Tax=Rhizobium laguerreae TaxID=1076926 RepID=UPI001C91EFE6|nr:hypothetical protein [Rhizobium laguerreae]MBY3332507.1 hypothetical protein [Rhizobium laguerreae]